MADDTDSRGVDRCLAAVAGLFSHLGDRLRDAAEVLGRDLVRPGDASPTAKHVLELAEPLAAAVLEDGRVLGSGFVADPWLAADATYLLAWWQGEDRERIAESAALKRAVDYSTKEWFRTPLRTGEVHVTGPYVDYVCTDEFVMTITAPVRRGVGSGSALGVTGADVLVETVEQELAEPFGAAGATLVNQHDRVVVPGDARGFAGDRVDRASYPVGVPCPGLPLTVLPCP